MQLILMNLYRVCVCSVKFEVTFGKLERHVILTTLGGDIKVNQISGRLSDEGNLHKEPFLFDFEEEPFYCIKCGDTKLCCLDTLESYQ